jgi:hypothetical protein
MLIPVVMSPPDKTPALPPSFGIMIPSYPTGEPKPPSQAQVGPRIKKPASRLEHDFNFQIVVFEVYFLSSSIEATIRTYF